MKKTILTAFLCAIYSLSGTSEENIRIDNLKRIKNPYDFILFSVQDLKHGQRIKVLFNDYDVTKTTFTLQSETDIQGMLWLSEKGRFFLNQKKRTLQIQIIGKNNKVFLEKSFTFDRIQNSSRMFPVDLAFSLINILSLPQSQTALMDEATMPINIFSLMTEDDFLKLRNWKSQNDETGCLSELFYKEYLILKKERFYARTVLDFARKHDIDIEVPENIRMIMKKKGFSASIERKALEKALTPFRKSYIYSTLFPFFYINNILREMRPGEAIKVYSDFKKHTKIKFFDRFILYAIKKIKAPHKPVIESSESLKYSPEKINKILKSPSIASYEKECIIESQIKALNKSNQLTPERISELIENIISISIQSSSNATIFLCLQLLPEKDNDINGLIAYEKGLVDFYENKEPNLIIALKKRSLPKFKAFYDIRRTEIITSIYLNTLKDNKFLGKYLYDYFRTSQKRQSSVFKSMKKLYPKQYQTLISLFQMRFTK